jgi:dihydrodipicolinate synthase/N-acetylneuraminate lyase
VIYGFGQPTHGAHQRMKVALCLRGLFPCPYFRPPVEPLPIAEIEEIAASLESIGVTCVRTAQEVYEQSQPQAV